MSKASSNSPAKKVPIIPAIPVAHKNTAIDTALYLTSIVVWIIASAGGIHPSPNKNARNRNVILKPKLKFKKNVKPWQIAPRIDIHMQT